MDFDHHANAQLIPDIEGNWELLRVSTAERYRTFPMRADWRFSKSDAISKVFGTMIAHLIKASHACWRIHAAMSLHHTDAEDVHKTIAEE